MTIITKDKLLELFTYDPNSGKFLYRGSKDRADHVMPLGYMRLRKSIGGKKCEVYAHRAAWVFLTGRWPDGEIDHINGNKADNRACNLRDVSRSENAKNCKRRADNSSGFTGIRRHQNGWKAICAGRYIGVSGCFAKVVEMRRNAMSQRQFHANHGRA